MASIYSTLFAHNAKAFEARLKALAANVCPADPRTADQLRSDAFGAVGNRNDRMACLCGSDECTAAQNPPATGVVVYVIASEDTLADPAPESERPSPRPETPAPPPEGEGTEDANVEPKDADAEPDEVDASSEADELSAQSERAALDGEQRMFDKPLRDLTLTEALTPPAGYFSTLRPAALMGGQFLPGAIACRAAIGATITPIVHPGQAPPEKHYRPSTRLADFVRARDMTCRFPGCRVPATQTDIDHTIPWPHGPTAASNLKCVCRHHHLLKTFWGGENGWRDRQLDDGTIIWTAPDGHEFVTRPAADCSSPNCPDPPPRSPRPAHPHRTPKASPCRGEEPPEPKPGPTTSPANASERCRRTKETRAASARRRARRRDVQRRTPRPIAFRCSIPCRPGRCWTRRHRRRRGHSPRCRPHAGPHRPGTSRGRPW